MRSARVKRSTRETSVTADLELDGAGGSSVETGIPFLDHMLDQLARHARFDLTLKAEGDLHVDAHHTVEDVGLVLGQALSEALGERVGIRRFGHAVVPLDEALVEVALDLSGRPHVEHDVPVDAEAIGAYDPRLTEDFLRAFATAGGITMHVRGLAGRSPHHVVEASFKALAQALLDACSVIGGDTPSTKGSLGR